MFRSDLPDFWQQAIFSWGVESWEEDLERCGIMFKWPGGWRCLISKHSIQGCRGYNDAYHLIGTYGPPRKGDYPGPDVKEMPTPERSQKVTYTISCDSGFCVVTQTRPDGTSTVVAEFQEDGPVINPVRDLAATCYAMDQDYRHPKPIDIPEQIRDYKQMQKAYREALTNYAAYLNAQGTT